jgi:hypothetical protein
VNNALGEAMGVGNLFNEAEELQPVVDDDCSSDSSDEEEIVAVVPNYLRRAEMVEDNELKNSFASRDEILFKRLGSILTGNCSNFEREKKDVIREATLKKQKKMKKLKKLKNSFENQSTLTLEGNISGKNAYDVVSEKGSTRNILYGRKGCSMRKDLGMKDDDVLMVEKDTIVVPKSEDSGIEILITPTKKKGIAQYQSNIEDYFKRKRAEKDNAGNDLKRRKI